jgi:hypothetical protein
MESNVHNLSNFKSYLGKFRLSLGDWDSHIRCDMNWGNFGVRRITLCLLAHHGAFLLSTPFVTILSSWTLKLVTVSAAAH